MPAVHRADQRLQPGHEDLRRMHEQLGLPELRSDLLEQDDLRGLRHERRLRRLYPHCDDSDHNCKQCLESSQCPGSLPHCNQNGDCVQCTSSSHCPTTHLCHPSQQKCQPKCATESDCAGYVTTPHCKTSIGMCVECFSNMHCSSGEECQADECKND